MNYYYVHHICERKNESLSLWSVFARLLCSALASALGSESVYKYVEIGVDTYTKYCTYNPHSQSAKTDSVKAFCLHSTSRGDTSGSSGSPVARSLAHVWIALIPKVGRLRVYKMRKEKKKKWNRNGVIIIYILYTYVHTYIVFSCWWCLSVPILPTLDRLIGAWRGRSPVVASEPLFLFSSSSSTFRLTVKVKLCCQLSLESLIQTRRSSRYRFCEWQPFAKRHEDWVNCDHFHSSVSQPVCQPWCPEQENAIVNINC